MKKNNFFFYKIILFSICLFGLNDLKSQDLEEYYASFDQVPVQTSFLLNKAFFTAAPLERFFIDSNSVDLSERVIFSNAFDFGNLYINLDSLESDGSDILPSLSSFYTTLPDEDPNISIGGVFLDTDYIPIEYLGENYDSVTNIVSPDVPLETVNVFAISNLREYIANQDVIFHIDTSHFFTNRMDEILGIEIDFGDNQSAQYFPFENQTVPVHYSEEGEKSLTYKLITTEDTLICYSKIVINVPVNEDISAVSNAILSNGSTSKAHYNIYLGCDQTFDKPFFIVEGFDPLNDPSPSEILSDYYSIISCIKNAGYDLVTVTFEDNHNALEDNSRVLQQVIRDVNALKVGKYENIVLGASMGGILTRMALKEMENANEDHQTRLYISFDAPHKGANTPLSLQQLGHDGINNWVTYFADGLLEGLSFIESLVFGDGLLSRLDASVDGMQEFINANNAIAARQLLIRHKNYPDSPNDDFLDLQDILSDLGYPEKLRKVSIINGSNQASKQMLGNDSLEIGDYYVNIDADFFGTGFTAFAKVSPVEETNFPASLIRARALWFFKPLNKEGHFTFFEKSYDNAPGGLSEYKDIRFSFVPTVSGIDLDESIVAQPNGLFYFNQLSSDTLRNKRGIVRNGLTPFDDIYSSHANSGHVNVFSIDTPFDNLLYREGMFFYYNLQNRLFINEESRDFYGKYRVSLGRDVDEFYNKEIETGNVIVESGSQVNIKSEGSIVFNPGVDIKNGATLNAYIQNSSQDCYFPFDKNQVVTENRVISKPVIKVQTQKETLSLTVDNPSPWGTERDYNWTITGVNTAIQENGISIQLDDLPIGQYTATCSLFNGERVNSKVFAVTTSRKISDERTEENAIANAPITTDIAILPNPTTGVCKLQYEVVQAGMVRISIFDSFGKLVQEEAEIYQNQGVYTTNMDISDAAKGIYFVRININEQQHTLKLIKL